MTAVEIAGLVERQHERERRLVATHVLLAHASHPWLAAELHEEAGRLREAFQEGARELDDLLAGCDGRTLALVAARVRG